MRDYEEKSYYEIQLDNKQLILAFLAAITVCVLIFILGVMIGKGQKEAEMAALSKPENTSAGTNPDIHPPVEPKSDLLTEPQKEKKQKKAGKKSEPAKEGERYAFEDLDKTEPEENPPEEKKLVAQNQPKQEENKEEPTPDEPSESGHADSGSAQFTVQVMATGSLDKAQTQIKELKAKGYTPFLDQTKSENGATTYRVRIGRFVDTVSARQLASRLKQDMKIDTWVTVLD